jgi:Family of unknown function (DUF5996)
MKDVWPELATPGWLERASTLHMWSQIVGKTRLALEPMLNHWWQITLYVTSRGLATPVLHDGERAFEVEFDLVDHALRVRDATGRTPSFPLEPMSVAEFYRRYRATLGSIGVELRIWPHPVEVVEAIPFDRDEVHRSYDPTWARALSTVLLGADAIFKEFRGSFLGKASPVHFFWGGFDLAVTRFNGKRAPERPEFDRMEREAYSHEVISAGFWPGSGTMPEPAFFSYAKPEPAGFKDARVAPSATFYNRDLNMFLLPYEEVRRTSSPRATLLDFLQSTYEAAANLAHWNRAELERATALR